jgi:hypothetical protein
MAIAERPRRSDPQARKRKAAESCTPDPAAPPAQREDELTRQGQGEPQEQAPQERHHTYNMHMHMHMCMHMYMLHVHIAYDRENWSWSMVKYGPTDSYSYTS